MGRTQTVRYRCPSCKEIGFTGKYWCASQYHFDIKYIVKAPRKARRLDPEQLAIAQDLIDEINPVEHIKRLEGQE